METKTESKEQQCKDPISLSSSSRSSSITSDSSDGHYDIRNFPLPRPSFSASEAQKQRESHQAYSSSVSSYTGWSWSSVHQNHLADSPGYDPTRIPSSVFSSKPVNSTEWSMASNESLFSLHDVNFSISTMEDHGLAAALRLGETPRFEKPVHEITEINTLPLPPPLAPAKKPTEPEEETIAEKKPNQVEKSDSEIDDDDQNEEKEMTELESGDEHEEEEEEDNMIEADILVETKTEKEEEKEVAEDAKENKPEDTNSTISHSPSISCHSETSNNSISSFAFPPLQKEEGVDKTPSMEIRANVSYKRRPAYLRPQSRMQPAQPKPLPYSEPCTSTQLQPQSQPQRKAFNKFESQTQPPKTSRNGWFSCFHCPSKRGLFK